MTDYERLKKAAVKERERFKNNLLIYLCKTKPIRYELYELVDATDWNDFVCKITPKIHEMYDDLVRNGVENTERQPDVLASLLKIRLSGEDEDCDCLDCLKEEVTSSVEEIIAKQVELIDLIKKLFEKIPSGK